MRVVKSWMHNVKLSKKTRRLVNTFYHTTWLQKNEAVESGIYEELPYHVREAATFDIAKYGQQPAKQRSFLPRNAVSSCRPCDVGLSFAAACLLACLLARLLAVDACLVIWVALPSRLLEAVLL